MKPGTFQLITLSYLQIKNMGCDRAKQNLPKYPPAFLNHQEVRADSRICAEISVVK